VTDGDIRRAILHGQPLATPVREIMNANPRFAMAGTPPTELARVLRLLKINQLPLLDDAGRVIDLFVIAPTTSFVPRANRVVLMAGGLGKRLRPLTETVPKPMLPIGGKPILQLIIESFARQGFSNFTLSVNYLEGQIRRHFEDGSRWNVSIDYVADDMDSLGTAGSLRLLEKPPTEPFIVMNGDILTSINFHNLLSFHEEHGSVATMAVFEHKVDIPFGVVDIADHRIAAIREKPTQYFFVNAGIYVLNKEVLELVPTDRAFDMPTLFETLAARGRRPMAFPIWEPWLDIGRPEDLERAQRSLSPTPS
jgi:NDP-sugar pyrophosphorylase family protein